MGSTKHTEDLFLNWLLKQKDENYVSRKVIILEAAHLQSLSEEIRFTKNDSIDIQKQITKNNSSTFNYSVFAGKTFLDDSTLHKEKQKNGNTYLKISKPIFFEKKKRVWIFVEKHCPDTCGTGNIEIYEKRGEEYKLIGIVLIWIS